MGTVEAIFVAHEARAEPIAVSEVLAVPGRGLEGDRYHQGTGTFTNWKGSRSGEALTLIEAEALDTLEHESGIELAPGASRRNVVTRGISLERLVGRRFRIGKVDCYGDRPCDPCRHLELLTEHGVLRGLSGRGGLRADILIAGRIAVGDRLDELAAA